MATRSPDPPVNQIEISDLTVHQKAAIKPAGHYKGLGRSSPVRNRQRSKSIADERQAQPKSMRQIQHPRPPLPEPPRAAVALPPSRLPSTSGLRFGGVFPGLALATGSLFHQREPIAPAREAEAVPLPERNVDFRERRVKSLVQKPFGISAFYIEQGDILCLNIFLAVTAPLFAIRIIAKLFSEPSAVAVLKDATELKWGIRHDIVEPYVKFNSIEEGGQVAPIVFVAKVLEFCFQVSEATYMGQSREGNTSERIPRPPDSSRSKEEAGLWILQKLSAIVGFAALSIDMRPVLATTYPQDEDSNREVRVFLSNMSTLDRLANHDPIFETRCREMGHYLSIKPIVPRRGVKLGEGVCDGQPPESQIKNLEKRQEQEGQAKWEDFRTTEQRLERGDQDQDDEYEQEKYEEQLELLVLSNVRTTLLKIAIAITTEPIYGCAAQIAKLQTHLQTVMRPVPESISGDIRSSTDYLLSDVFASQGTHQVCSWFRESPPAFDLKRITSEGFNRFKETEKETVSPTLVASHIKRRMASLPLGLVPACLRDLFVCWLKTEEGPAEPLLSIATCRSIALLLSLNPSRDAIYKDLCRILRRLLGPKTSEPMSPVGLTPEEPVRKMIPCPGRDPSQNVKPEALARVLSNGMDGGGELGGLAVIDSLEKVGELAKWHRAWAVLLAYPDVFGAGEELEAKVSAASHALAAILASRISSREKET
ncbi:hypothetical protein BDK51DRAFT_51064 [Blyttiomyces helicus]|uniref:Uncharacterized protein n=1 Tax=Blyttiomyces helicus TaxID=388810 RepID=A0A4P9WL79_9FUNG|nr:hypothetical protein BDK51DRAFT_51064 [Blyttiomyces helicus]|eukprot:RKO93614.1 hypothetical protein BDK51DRAFT_51064 [Blyttiomyces helicus]